MAGDWIKVEKGIFGRPALFRIAEGLGVSVPEAFERCFEVWSWADTHLRDGVIPSSVVDQMNRHRQGILKVMLAVGWLEDAGDGCLFVTNFGKFIEGKKSRDTWVYFIRAGQDGPIKIGRAKNPGRRIYSIQTSHHEKLRVLGLIDEKKLSERGVHEKFAHLRIRGEWFHPDKSLLDFIAENCKE